MSTHPVWDVYDLLRTARLNVKYYSSVLIRYTQIRLFLEIALAFSASSVVVVGLTLSDASFGKPIWMLLSCLTAIIAVINPVLDINGKLRAIEKVLNEYLIISFELENLAYEIKIHNEYNDNAKRRFEEILQRKSVIGMEEPLLRVDGKLVKRKSEEVLEEMPVSAFYVPEIEGD